MPLREDLLTPIPGDNPSGTYLYYAPIYDKIKEARRQDDDTGPSGVWARERKTADWNLVIKLAGEALATQTKDLQLAVWLTEAYFRKEGFPLLRDSFDMLRQMLETFWDTIYPEIEDGDAEFRATPLSWLGNFDLQIRMASITRGGLSAVDYKVSQGIGYKADAEQASYDKLEEYNNAVKDGKVTGEAFDADFDKTPKKYYVDLVEVFASCLDSLENLQVVCEQKFGDDAPGFSKLRKALEETGNTVRSLLNRKREKEPDEPLPGEAVEEEPAEEETPSYVETAAPVAAAPVKKKTGSLAAEPQDADDALARIVGAAKYLREQDAYSPAPFMLLAGFRFGELRAGGETVDASRLDAPPTEIRQQMKKASLESDWTTVLATTETALALPCGRGWLDLHRYAARACTELGWYYDGFRKGIVAGVRALLQDYPDLHKMTMLDDTPTANAETMQWIEADVLVAGGGVTANSAPSYDPEPATYPSYSEPASEALGAPPDAWELAQQALRGGRVREAVELIDREAKMERSGRGRFLRKTQLARIFIDSGNEPMALPILEQLAFEIETRSLEDWEPSETIAHPLSLLYRCLARTDREGETVKKLYAKLCRLDPVAAMSMLR
ncbi:MAG TPA: type VI secretion system protein TssA [Bryobacteraceae bacterium]|nr:type VI secretion system protein TssA [Bryobacteraceae bacterium]